MPFTLLSDSEKKMKEDYGASNGISTKRITYIVDKNGIIVKVYPKVDPASHALTILDDVKQLDFK